VGVFRCTREGALALGFVHRDQLGRRERADHLVVLLGLAQPGRPRETATTRWWVATARPGPATGQVGDCLVRLLTVVGLVDRVTEVG
jgi:hypothetical protein